MIKTKIDLRKVCSYAEGEFDKKINSRLLKAGLLSDDYVYTVFNFGRAEHVAQNGLTIPPREKVFYAFSKNELFWDNGEPNCLSVCVKQVILNPGIAVYDSNHLKRAIIANSKFGYEFKDKTKAIEALKGLVKILMPC